jgi:hypothetical protein
MNPMKCSWASDTRESISSIVRVVMTILNHRYNMNPRTRQRSPEILPSTHVCVWESGDRQEQRRQGRASYSPWVVGLGGLMLPKGVDLDEI